MPMRAPLATTLLLILTACGQTDAGPPQAGQADTAATQTAGADCTSVDAPLLDIEPRSAGEPRVRIPQPPGWERYTDMDSVMIRAALINKSLTADDFAPNVVYTLDELPGDIDPQHALDLERDGLVKAGHATDLEVTQTTVCGLPGQTVNYKMAAAGSREPHPIILREAVARTGGKTYVISLTIQTRKPDDPTYQRDSATILDGLQVLTPAG
jgi:hypothetical protein